MTVRFLVLLSALCALSACGRDTGPDEPLYEIDAASPAAPADPRLAGCWAGALATGVTPRPLVLSVRLDPARVRLVSPAQSGAVVALEQVRLDGPRLAAATRLGAFRIDLALDGSGGLSGEVVQGGLTDTITFERSGGSAPDC